MYPLRMPMLACGFVRIGACAIMIANPVAGHSAPSLLPAVHRSAGSAPASYVVRGRAAGLLTPPPPPLHVDSRALVAEARQDNV